MASRPHHQPPHKHTNNKHTSSSFFPFHPHASEQPTGRCRHWGTCSPITRRRQPVYWQPASAASSCCSCSASGEGQPLLPLLLPLAWGGVVVGLLAAGWWCGHLICCYCLCRELDCQTKRRTHLPNRDRTKTDPSSYNVPTKAQTTRPKTIIYAPSRTGSWSGSGAPAPPAAPSTRTWARPRYPSRSRPSPCRRPMYMHMHMYMGGG